MAVLALSGSVAAADGPAVVSAVEYDEGTVEIVLDEPVPDPNAIEFYDGSGALINRDTTPSMSNDNHTLVADASRDLWEIEVVTVTVVDGSGSEVVSNASVTETTVTASVNTTNPDDVTVYEGELLALTFETEPADTASENIAFERRWGGFTSGPINTGTNSTVFVVNSFGLNQIEHRIVVDDPRDGDSAGDTLGANVSVEGFRAPDVDLDETHYWTSENLTGTVTLAPNRTVTVRALDADGKRVGPVVEGSTGPDGAFDFDLGQFTAGNYTVEGVSVATGSDGAVDATVEPKPGPLGFGDSRMTVVQGNVAELTVTFEGNTDTVFLVVGDEGVGYQANVTVTDGVGDSPADGEVTLLFSTRTAGHSATIAPPVLGVADANNDSATFVEDSPARFGGPHLLAVGDYPIRAHWDSIEAALADSDASGTLIVRQRSTDSMTTWRGAESLYADLESGGDVTAAIENGDLVGSDTFNAGDTAVFRIEATGLNSLAALDRRDIAPNNPIDGGLSGDATALTVEQTNDTTAPNRDPKRLDLDGHLGSGIEILHTPRTDVYFVAVDLSQDVFDQNGRNVSIAVGDEFDAAFTVTEDGPFANDNETVTTTFGAAESGDDGDGSPGGSGDGEGDDSGDSDGTTPSGTASLTVGNVSVSETDVDLGDAVFVTATVANDGDADGQRNVTLFVDDDAVATQAVFVPAGAKRTVTLEYAFQTAGEYDLAVENGTVASVTVDAATPGRSPTTAASATAGATSDTATDDGAGPEPSSPEEPTTEGVGPGFGVALALLGLLCGCVLLGRRV